MTTVAPRRDRRGVLLAATGIALLVLAADLVGRTGLAGPAWPTATDLLAFLGGPTAGPLLLRAIGATGTAALLGFLLGGLAALAVAVLGVVLPALHPGLDRLAAVLHAVPLIALGPLLVTTVGREGTSTVVAAIAAGFAVFVAATSGLATPGEAQQDVFRVLGASRWTTLLRLRFPAGLPTIVDGLTLAAPAAVLGAVIGEWFGARRGIGVLLVSAMQNVQIPLLWTAALSAAGLSLLAYLLLVGLHRYTVRRFT
ncbi:ABC transporter permease subunit [Pseudonocardia kongjuensis]|uniref:ABC transporter permease subunit n=1 Tax=Pseudonocardia kongjuensis TaxID=102227 RepID=A0ABP4IC26_9PSEU